jgi:hypothetical protein
MISFSQNENLQEKITTSLNNYFEIDRENIHVQFNKTIFLNDEDISYKGYVFSKFYNLPNIYTTNVQLVIYNDQHTIVQKQLLYSRLGYFEGSFHLGEKFKPGKYYFHFFTNWMNNFVEDDSFLQVIEVINNKESYSLKTITPNEDTATISFYPESGRLIDGINNRVGIKIVDCDQKGIEINGSIVDSKSTVVANFKTNKLGYGHFFYFPDSNTTYTIKINSDKIHLSQLLPKAEPTGITISCNNNFPGPTLAIAVKTNTLGNDLYKNKKFILLIHQYGNSVQKEFTFDTASAEKDFFFKKKDLFKGVNTIRIIDENLNEVAQRLIYLDESPKPKLTMEAIKISKDSILLTGNSLIKNGNLSISVLPEKSELLDWGRSILGTFYLNAFIENPEQNTYSYFDIENNSKTQDLDLLLLNQKKGKYIWDNIKSTAPIIKYPFTKGITISGKIEEKISPKSNHKIILIDLKSKSIQETSVDEKNEYKFENFIAKDSTVYLLQLVNEKNKSIKTKIPVTISQLDTLLKIPINIQLDKCPKINKNETIYVFKNPTLNPNTINLNEVTLKNTYKKEVFIHKKEVNTVTASAYKIGENDFGNVLDFINIHGYKTGINFEDNGVYIRNSRSFGGGSSSSPSVYLDNEILFDLNPLYNLNLSDVDEIYIDKSGFSDMSSKGGGGTIKIYLKKGVNNIFINPNYTSLIVTNGFSKQKNYTKMKFEDQKEFDYFGTLNWSPKIELKDTSIFKLTFPKENQTNIIILIQGFSEDGQLLSEIKKIPII